MAHKCENCGDLNTEATPWEGDLILECFTCGWTNDLGQIGAQTPSAKRFTYTRDNCQEE